MEAIGMTDIAGIANDRVGAGLLMKSSRGIEPQNRKCDESRSDFFNGHGSTLPAQFAGYRQRNRKQKLSLPNCVAP
jgi:hypothetical protein